MSGALKSFFTGWLLKEKEGYPQNDKCELYKCLHFSTKDAAAAKAVGQVLAHRCLQLGITEVSCFLSEEDRKKEKV